MHAADSDFAESTSRLLRAWVRGRSGEAFRQLVARHLDMVHSVAVRRLGDQRDAAPDVAQAVFVLLARKADALPGNVVLGAWLHRQTIRQCLNFLRSENRRRRRESEVAAAAAGPTSSMNARTGSASDDFPAPHSAAADLDEAIAGLPARDRDILHLRYFENRGATEIAAVLGISAEAAQKRAERALANLRARLSRRPGLSLSLPAVTAALGTLVSEPTARAAPGGLAESIAGKAVSDFQNAGILTRLARNLRSRPLTALAGAATGLALGWAAFSVSPSSAGNFPAVTALTDSARRSVPPGGAFRVAGMDQAESVLAALERIGRSPANFRARVAFDALLIRPEAADLGSIAEQAAARLSPRAMDQAMSLLLKAWADRDPAAVMKFLTVHREAFWTGGRFSQTYDKWLDADREAASQWLLAVIQSKSELGKGTMYDSPSSLAETTVKTLTYDHPEAGLRFFLQLPESFRKSSLDELADDSDMELSRSRWPAENWSRLATAAAAGTAGGRLEAGALGRILRQWRNRQPEAAAAWEQSAAAPMDSRTRLWVELQSLARPTLMEMADSGLQSLRKPEVYLQHVREVLQSTKGLSPSEALLITARAWSGEPAPLITLLQSQNAEGAGDAALAIAIRRQWGRVSLRMGLSSTPKDAAAGVLQACESITDPAIREPLVIGLFRRWHSSQPAEAGQWLAQNSSHWLADRLAVIHQRLAQP